MNIDNTANTKIFEQNSGSTRTTSPWIVAPDLQKAVDKYIEEDPNRHKIALRFGEFLVNHTLSSSLENFNVDAKDLAGEEIKFRELEKLMSYYGIKPSEMSIDERAILAQKIGPTWREQLKEKYGFSDIDLE